VPVCCSFSSPAGQRAQPFRFMRESMRETRRFSIPANALLAASNRATVYPEYKCAAVSAVGRVLGTFCQRLFCYARRFPIISRSWPLRRPRTQKPPPTPRPRARREKPAVRIVVLKGAMPIIRPRRTRRYVAAAGGLEKPGSFFRLVEKLDRWPGRREFSHVLFDRRRPTLHLKPGTIAELSRHS